MARMASPVDLISSPHHQLRTILQRLRQMCRLDFLTPRQVRIRACQFQDAVISPRRQIELSHRRPHQTLTFVLQSTKLRISPIRILALQNSDQAVRVFEHKIIYLACDHNNGEAISPQRSTQLE